MGTRAVDQSRMVETGTLDRMLRVDGGGQCWAA